MSLVLAIEPDTLQVDALRQVVCDRIGAELELVTSTEAAVVSMNRRVPDLLLCSATISDTERDTVVQYFRRLADVPDQPVLNIVRLCRHDEPPETSRLGFRRKRQAHGISQAEFADLIAGALAGVQDARPALAAAPDAAPPTQPDIPRPAEPLDDPLDLLLQREPPPKLAWDETLAVIVRAIDDRLKQASAGEPAGLASSQTLTAEPSPAGNQIDGTLSDLGHAGDEGDHRLDTRQASDDVAVARARAGADAGLEAELGLVRHDTGDTWPAEHHTTIGANQNEADIPPLQAGAEAGRAAEIHYAHAAATGERVARLGRFQAEAEALLAVAVTEARAASEAEARNALGAELAKVRSAAEHALPETVSRVRNEAEQTFAAELSRVLAENERTVNELGLARAEADHLRDTPLAPGDADATALRAGALEEARRVAEAAAARALDAEVARVREEAEGRLQTELERVRQSAHAARLAERAAHLEAERRRDEAAREARDLAAHALETEVARIGAEAETRLQAEVARIRREVEQVRLSAQADARIEAARVRDTAAQEARAIAEVTLKAELERVRPATTTRLDGAVASRRARTEQRPDTDVRRIREPIGQVDRPAEVRPGVEARRGSSDRGTNAIERHPERGRSNAHVESWRRRAAVRVSDWRRTTVVTLSAAASIVLIAAGSMVVDVTAAVGAAQHTVAAWFTPGDTASPAHDTAPITAAGQAAPSPQVGELRVESTPAGARVMLDGRERGLSPLTLTGVRAGRHTLVLRGDGGTVTRTVTVRADERTVAAEPIISGFLTVFSRIRLDIYTDGRRIGTTEDGQLLLAPGRHTLTLANDHFNYRSTVTVVVQPGAATSYTAPLPNGSLRVNANPGAEVWIEGERVGTAPLGELSVPIGTREVLVKDPAHGERRQFVEVRYGHPTEVTLVQSTIASEDHLVRLAP